MITSEQTLTFWPFTVALTLNAVIQLFSQVTLAYDDVSSDQIWLSRNQQFRKYSRKSHILIIWAFAVTLTWRQKQQQQQNSTWHFGSWCCITISNLVTKCCSENIKKISSRQTFIRTNNHRHFEPSLWPWPWMQYPIFQQDTGLWCCTINPSLVANQPAV